MKLILVALMSLSVLTGCSTLTEGLLKDPTVKVLDFSVANVTAEDISLNLKLNVFNPNALPLNLGKVSYALKFSGEEVTQGIADQGISIPAEGENTMVLPLKFKYNSLNSLISSLFKNTFTKDYELNGSAQLGIFSIPFNKKGELKFTK